MSATPAGRSWTCVGCAVTASFGPSATGAVPDGWSEGEGGWLCLACRRDAVVEAVMVTGEGDPRASQRHALTEFELLRDPEATDGQIARRVKTSPAVVRPVRAQLREAGRLPAP